MKLLFSFYLPESRSSHIILHLWRDFLVPEHQRPRCGRVWLESRAEVGRVNLGFIGSLRKWWARICVTPYSSMDWTFTHYQNTLLHIYDIRSLLWPLKCTFINTSLKRIHSNNLSVQILAVRMTLTLTKKFVSLPLIFLFQLYINTELVRGLWQMPYFSFEDRSCSPITAAL